MESLVFLFVLIFLGMAIFGRLLYGNYVNPITLFCGMWALILFLYSLHIFDLYDASDLTLTIIIVGIFAFFIGGICSTASFKNKSYCVNHRLNAEEFGDFQLNYNLMLILNVASIIVLLAYALVTIRLLLSGYSMAYVRMNYMSEEGSSVGGSTLSAYIMSFFIWPWNYVIIPLSVILFCFRKEDPEHDREIKNFIFTTLINVALFVLVTAGRISLVYYVFYFVVIAVLFLHRLHLNWKQIGLVAVFAVAAYAVISIISESRGSRALSENLYLYLCGCVPLMSIKLEHFITTSHTFTYGYASFYGFIMLLIVPLSKLIGYPELYVTAVENSYVQDRAYIAPSIGYNAFVTPFYYFYIDGGMIGVILLSFLFGYVSVNFYKRLISRRTWKDLLFYCLITFSLVFSMVRFQFATTRYVLAFFYAFLCFSRKIRRIHIRIGNKVW